MASETGGARAAHKTSDTRLWKEEPNLTERRAAEEAVGHRATPTSANSLPKPDWDSGNMSMTPLPPGSPPQWHTLHHGLGSTNLLVDAKLGGTNAQGQAVWSLSTETLLALSGPNTLRFRWA